MLRTLLICSLVAGGCWRGAAVRSSGERVLGLRADRDARRCSEGQKVADEPDLLKAVASGVLRRFLGEGPDESMHFESVPGVVYIIAPEAVELPSPPPTFVRMPSKEAVDNEADRLGHDVDFIKIEFESTTRAQDGALIVNLVATRGTVFSPTSRGHSGYAFGLCAEQVGDALVFHERSVIAFD